MTYSSTITADAPLLYFHLDETDVNVTGRTVANSGSTGGTATITKNGGTITAAQTGAGTIGGSSWYINNGQIYGSKATGTVTSTKNWSLEVWYKEDTNYSAGSGIILAQMTGSAGNFGTMSLGLADTLSSNQVNFTCAGNVISTTAVNMRDGGWHHIVGTFDSTDSKHRLYIDGVQRAVYASTNTNMTANTSATFAFGGYSTGGMAGWTDEPALYNKTLTLAQIQAHYTAGTAVAAVDVHPIVSGTMTQNLSAPLPNVHIVTPINKTSTVSGAMTLSLTAPSVTQFVTTGVVEAVDLDRSDSTSSYTSDMTVFDSIGSNRAFFHFPTTVGAAQVLTGTGTFSFSTNTATSVAQTYTVYRLTSAFNESSNNSPTMVATSHTGTMTAGKNTVSISEALAAWQGGATNYGIALVFATRGAPNTGWTIYSRENADVTKRPAATLDVTAVVLNVDVPVPAMTASLSAAAPVVTALRSITVAAPAASLSLDEIAPGVRTQFSVKTTAQVISADLSFVGGVAKNPDFWTIAPAINAGSIISPDAKLFIRYDKLSTVVGAMELNLAGTGAVVNLTTNRLSKVNGAMKATAKMVGIYQKENDRYYNYVKTTMDDYAVWLEMDEASGNSAADSAYSLLSNGIVHSQSNMTYVGNPTFRVDGPELRKAVHFDGIDDYIHMDHPNSPGVPPYDAPTTGGINSVPFYGTNGGTVEFSIRTTAQNGTIFAGGGGGASGFSPFPILNTNVRMRLIDGQLWFHGSGDADAFKVRATINDGEWHHVIVSIDTHFSEGIPDAISHVYVDGISALARLGTLGVTGNQLMPRSVMANRTTLYDKLGGTSLSAPDDLLAGDMRDFIYRMNKPVDPTTAQKLYYEWSNATIVIPSPMTVTLSGVAPFRVKGNVKKMLAIYGLPETYADGPTGNGDAEFKYRSTLSGLTIKHFDIDGYGNQKTNISTNPHHGGAAVSFMLDDWLIVPVTITGGSTSSGVLNGEYDYVPGGGQLYDDETGLPRFLDLQKDLVNIDDFDGITVVNYPWEKQMDKADTALFDESGAWIGQWGYYQKMPGMVPGRFSDFQWSHVRDQFRDSLLEAAYAGKSLWISEYHMAQHLGFIKDYDIHNTGYFVINAFAGGYNKGAYLIDLQHQRDGLTGAPKNPALMNTDNATGLNPPRNTFYFADGWQVNRFRRIVATEPGLTDIPSWEVVAGIQQEAVDPWDVKNSRVAWDIAEFPNGFRIGDRTEINSFGVVVISARPDGIAGKVITREMDWYWGPEGVHVDNPYKNNAFTIVAERGTVVRGRAIRGRAFIELAGADQYKGSVYEDRVKNMDRSNPTAFPTSAWSFDTGRYRDMLITVTRTFLKLTGNGIQSADGSFQYSDSDDIDVINRPHVGMQSRGLNWLAQMSNIPAGEAHVYVPSMELNVTMPAPTLSKTRNLNIPVTGAMRVDLDLRQPRNYRGNDGGDKALPMVLNLEMRGIGKKVKAPAMTLTLALPNATIKAGGDRIKVYLDGDRNVTLFLKEDN
jgi:hypothetical protein